MTEAVNKYTLESLLPVIRTFPAAGTTSLDRLQDGLAVYRDRFAFFETKSPRELPEELWEAEGWKLLKEASKVRKAETFSLDKIAQIYASNRKLFGCWWLGSAEQGREFRIYLRDGRVGRWLVPETDARGVRTALALLLGERFVDNAALPPWSRTQARLGRHPGSPAIWTLVLLFVTVLLVSFFGKSLLAWNPWPQGTWMSDLRASGFGRVVAETIPSKDTGSVAESLGYLSAEFMMQNSFAIPALVTGFIAFPGAVFFIVYLWALGILVTSPLRLWSNARKRQTDLPTRERRNPAKMTDLSVRRPLPLLWAGWVLKLTGAIAILGGLYFATVFDLHDAAFSAAGGASTTPGATRSGVLLIGASLIFYGHRLARRDGHRALARDQRAPIVYFRPFAIDGRNNFNPSGLLAQLLGLAPFGLLRPFGPLGNINPLRLVRLFFGRAGEHSEEQIAQFFRRYGPFVAIGKPGQLIPQTGALRLFVEDREWKMTADELLSRAGMVVLQPSDSEGIRWEVERALTTISPQKVLLCLQLFDGRQGRYDEFRIWVEEITRMKFPRRIGDAMFIFFDCNRQAKSLRLCEHLPVFWPISGCAVNFKRTLAPFLASSIGQSSSRGQIRPATRLSEAFWSITAVLTWSFVLTLPWLLVDRVDVYFRNEGVKTLRDSKDHQWAWQLSSVWQPVQPKNSGFAAQFLRIDGGVESVIALMTLENAESIDPERFADAAEANFQRMFSGLARIGRRQIKSGGLEWLETEYGLRSPGKERHVITRTAILERKVLFILGTYTENDHRESESLHRHTVEALDGFLWKAPTGQTALTTPAAGR